MKARCPSKTIPKLPNFESKFRIFLHAIFFFSVSDDYLFILRVREQSKKIFRRSPGISTNLAINAAQHPIDLLN